MPGLISGKIRNGQKPSGDLLRLRAKLAETAEEMAGRRWSAWILGGLARRSRGVPVLTWLSRWRRSPSAA
jgi:hypothetical protein